MLETMSSILKVLGWGLKMKHKTKDQKVEIGFEPRKNNHILKKIKPSKPRSSKLLGKNLTKKGSDGSDIAFIPSDSFANDLLDEVRDDEIKELEESIKEQEKNLKQQETSDNDKGNLPVGALRQNNTIHQKEKNLAISPSDDIKLIPKDSEIIKRCPVCNGKLKKSWIKKKDNIYAQKFRCKGKGFLFWKEKCEFNKEVMVKII